MPSYGATVVYQHPATAQGATENPNVGLMLTESGVIVGLTVDTVNGEQRHTTAQRPGVVEQTRAPSINDGYTWSRDDNYNLDDSRSADYDPFQSLSEIEDMLEAVPDSITSENVQQYLAALPFIPAADIVSRLEPSAVS